MEHTYAVIMAGGGGTRLWPVSRKNRPKQMIPLVENRTLFQATVQRLDGLFPPERILVVTVEGQAAELMAQVPDLPRENFLLEPEARGTASAIGLAAAILNRRDPQAIMASLHSDHFIRNNDLFGLLLRVASDVAKKDYLVTLGITPTYPAVAYGYIQRGELLPEQFGYPAYRVLRFKEKPDQNAAHEMLRAGDHSWNSGMFIWRTSRIMAEFGRQMPELKSVLDELAGAWGTPHFETRLGQLWPALETETIDYGILENAEKLAVIPAGGLDWSDVGSWDSLFDVLLPDEHGNIVFSGHHIALDTHNSLVYGNRDNRLIVTIGVDDLVVVDSGDVLLVCRRDEAQKVRQMVLNLKNSGSEHYT
jgi:mannose-1-phosphate guanylyltransferase